MLFNSYIFILLFFPLCLAVFCLLESRRKAGAAKIWLILCSFWFYGYSNPYHLVLLLGSIAVNYGAFRLLWRLRGKGAAKAVLALGICLNLGALFYFKYYDFFAENINRLFGSELLLKNILLPLESAISRSSRSAFWWIPTGGRPGGAVLWSTPCSCPFSRGLWPGPLSRSGR